nr:hypothetical protein [Leptospira kirschneri]
MTSILLGLSRFMRSNLIPNFNHQTESFVKPARLSEANGEPLSVRIASDRVNSFVKTVITLSVFAFGTISQPKESDYASVIVNGVHFIPPSTVKWSLKSAH